MAYLQGFEPDIFISYSHIDDQPFGEEQKRWVSEFHRNLETRIRILLGQGVAVWRDPKLAGTDFFSDAIQARVADSAILVSIVFPGYLQSEWCSKELQTFIEAVQARGGHNVSGPSRIVKVLKTPVPLQKQTGLLGKMLGYEFYKVDPYTEKVREFHLEPSLEARSFYWTRLDDVAQDITRIFSSFLKPEDKASPEKCVYVAETTSDLKDKRDSLLRELSAHGFTPVPQAPLPLNFAELTGAIRNHLQPSRFSIHFIGTRYGIVPEGERRSLTEVQNEIAASHFSGSLRRLIWIPTDLKVVEEQQSRFLTDLRSNQYLLNNADLIETLFEDFKTELFRRLRSESQSEPDPHADTPAQLYIVCDKQDRSEAGKLKQVLFDAGFEVTMPLAEGDPAEIREDHVENLRISDGILIYWGLAGAPWFRVKIRDLLHLRAIRGSKKPPVQAVYVSATESNEKRDFHTRQAIVMRSFEGFEASVLTPFISELAKRSGAHA